MELDTKIIPYTYCMDCFNSEEEIDKESITSVLDEYLKENKIGLGDL